MAAGRATCSPVTSPHTTLGPQGIIYVEAEKEAHVRDAVKGLRSIWGGKGAQLVPQAEMQEAISVNTKAKAPIGERFLGCRACAQLQAGSV